MSTPEKANHISSDEQSAYSLMQTLVASEIAQAVMDGNEERVDELEEQMWDMAGQEFKTRSRQTAATDPRAFWTLYNNALSEANQYLNQKLHGIDPKDGLANPALLDKLTVHTFDDEARANTKAAPLSNKITSEEAVKSLGDGLLAQLLVQTPKKPQADKPPKADATKAGTASNKPAPIPVTTKVSWTLPIADTGPWKSMLHQRPAARKPAASSEPTSETTPEYHEQGGQIIESAEASLAERGEDAIVRDDEHKFYAVIDGMGGVDGGDVAANVIQSSLRNFVDKYGTKMNAENATELMKAAFTEAQDALRRAAERDDTLSPGMGAVLTTTWFFRNPDGTLGMAVGHVGDTRLMSQNKPGDRVANRTEDECHGNIVLNALTGDPENEFEATQFFSVDKVEPGSRYVLVSDGITGDEPEQFLTPKDYQTAFDIDDMQQAADRLIALSKKRDDKSVVVIDIPKITDVESMPESHDEPVEAAPDPVIDEDDTDTDRTSANVVTLPRSRRERLGKRARRYGAIAMLALLGGGAVGVGVGNLPDNDAYDSQKPKTSPQEQTAPAPKKERGFKGIKLTKGGTVVVADPSQR
jgi:serine/threonine protein phosphatase PrpC